MATQDSTEENSRGRLPQIRTVVTRTLSRIQKNTQMNSKGTRENKMQRDKKETIKQ